ncbi:hypothetical protein FT663_01524 [Candidozyma haemuli var. vulneris]|nr:hypothetical protein FT662_03146 [[Candida] haemuloni var. vulneris]KAF3994404.1 hypothetical protein FT663_01524 [[Candida] haemuloni var. vulneris]
MKVEELIIDGFKSYATRTVISNWDPQFNAITGLNGSGKSNILDAICFVLGIASMSTVRASNLQDLIYKRGQAGVTKASVTIVFDNSETEKSPIGFEGYSKISVTRQIILGGTSKYLVNGHKAQQQNVLNLFQSVQLNINNPNFLIMQGKITKVLNMKPSEILSLIEEAAGTKTFEDRKEKAQKTMTKKDVRLNEIKSLLSEEVEPKLEKFRKDKRTFLEFQQVQTDLERLSRFVSCCRYKDSSQKFDRYSTLRSEHENIKADHNAQIERLTIELENLNRDLEEVKKQRSSELSKGGTIEQLEGEETELSDKLTRLTTSRDLLSENIKEERAKLTRLQQQSTLIEESIANSKDNYQTSQNEYDRSKEKLNSLKEEHSKKEELLTALSTGVSAKGTDSGYMAQLRKAKEDLSESQGLIKQAELKIGHLSEKSRGDKARLETARQEYETLSQETKGYENEILAKEKKLASFGFDVKAYEDLRQQERELRQTVADYQNQLSYLRREVGNIDFQYSRPYPDFDAESVKGVAVQLFKLDEEHHDKALALQVCAGGRLYNVVVDNANIASALLEKGQLKRRVTIIPLDKISASSIPDSTVQYAKQQCPGKVELSLNLIDFEKELYKAMAYIFGKTFICQDPQTAKTITFDPKIRARSITFEGDVYDPEGNLSGGSRKNNSSTLLLMQKYNAVAQKLKQAETEHARVRHELARLDKLGEQTKTLQNELMLSRHEFTLVQKKLENNPASRMIKENEQNEIQAEEFKAQIESEKENSKALQEKINSIQKDIDDFNNDKGSKLKELDQVVKKIFADINKQNQEVKKSSEKFQKLEVEMEQQVQELDAIKESSTASQKVLEESELELKEMTETMTKLSDVLDAKRAQLEDERAKLLGFNDEIRELTETLTSKNEELNQAKLSIQKLNHDLENAVGITTRLKEELDNLLQENEWLVDESVVNNILHQHQGENVKDCIQRLGTLKERFDSMKKKVNANIMSQIDNVEKKEAALRNMIRTITRDKSKIENTIEKLNGYKRDTLNTTYQKVSDDFGNIFADLLPGSFAKLVPVNMFDVTKGLEVKVKLGQVWKESLTELSGGQRSLIALSLIMALLQFKPAPMYILDEVDAALDMSHTQNIGHLIKTRFKGSQFIIVSLKEGMFTNANRVFRTRFQDGTSMVYTM